MVRLLVATSGLLFTGHSLAVCSTGNQQYTVQVPLRLQRLVPEGFSSKGVISAYSRFSGYTAVPVTCTANSGCIFAHESFQEARYTPVKTASIKRGLMDWGAFS